MALLFLGITSCATATFVLYGRWQEARQAGLIVVEGGDPALSTAERVYLQGYLAANAAELARPVASGRSPISFTIEPGETAADVADKLVGAGLVEDRTLFLNYLRFYGLDSRLEAGLYELDPRLSLADLAVRLTESAPEEIQLRFLEGWRMEEMAERGG